MMWRLSLTLMIWLSPAFGQETPPTSANLLVNAKSFEFEEGRTIYEGNVTVSVKGMFLLTADKAILDAKGTFTASGSIKIDYYTEIGLVEITAREASLQRDGSSGMFIDVTAQFGDEFYFEGSRLEMLDFGREYFIDSGRATACNQANPQWSLSIREATIYREGYAFIKSARFYIKRVPVLYFPYFIMPVMQERRSGLLSPDTGHSERNGTFFSLPFYWAPRGDMDITLTPSYHEASGFKLDLEARYKPSATLFGNLTGNVFNDRVIEKLSRQGRAPTEDGDPIDSDRFRLSWQHDQNLLSGKLQIDVEAGSDFSVDRDYLQDADSTRLREYFYRASYDRNIRHNSLTLNLNRYERILSTDAQVQTISHLPELRFFQPNRAIGGGFFLRNYAYAALYDFEDLGPLDPSGENEDQVMRIGLDSELSKTQNWSRFLHTRWGLRYQGAYYNGSDQEDTRGGAFAFLETVGPRLHRVYDKGNRRKVHYLDALLTVNYGRQVVDPFLEGVFFDELDLRLADQVDGVRTAWKINSRSFTGERGLVRPFLEMELSQDVNFDSDIPNQPIKARFRLFNFTGFHTNGIFDYNPDEGTLDTLSVYSSVNRGEWRGYGGYVRRRPDETGTRESFIGITQWHLRRWRSRFKVALDYDFELNDFKSQEVLYGYQGQCVGASVKYVNSPFDSSRTGNRDFFQLTLSLRNLSENIGTKF